MKLFGLILAACIMQAFAFPSAIEDPSKPEHMPERKDIGDIEAIAQFRRDINMHYARFQMFYDLFTERMTNYRLTHAELVSEIGLVMMEIFSNDLEFVWESRRAVDHEVAQALTRLGGSPNACLQNAINDLATNSGRFGQQFNACCRRANATISNGLADIFYPTFNDIQLLASSVPLLTLSALSRGNPLASTTEITDYLDAQFRAIDIQWKVAASQLFRWESARFSTEGRFYAEEMNLCLLDPLENYRNMNTVIMFRIVDECAPTN